MFRDQVHLALDHAQQAFDDQEVCACLLFFFNVYLSLLIWNFSRADPTREQKDKGSLLSEHRKEADREIALAVILSEHDGEQKALETQNKQLVSKNVELTRQIRELKEQTTELVTAEETSCAALKTQQHEVWTLRKRIQEKEDQLSLLHTEVYTTTQLLDDSKARVTALEASMEHLVLANQ